MNNQQFDRLIRMIGRLAIAVEKVGSVIDVKKRTLRMVDVDRGKVYKTHLGKNLRKSAKSVVKKRGQRAH